MNACSKNRNGPCRGLLLIEFLAYVTIFLIVSGIAFKAFHDCWATSKAFRGNADDIARCLQAGERWRADVRAAAGPIEMAAADGAQTLRIPQPQGEIVYTFAKGELRRQAPSGAGQGVVVSHIKSSRMQSEPRPYGAVWRWELELASTRRNVALRPLFTFAAVAARGSSDEH